MEKTPKSMRLQIGLLGRTNVGKSSLLNMILNQDVSLVSEVAGTTTDLVEKSAELLPIGPVNFLDSGGIDDISELGSRRIERTRKIFNRADVALLIVEPTGITEPEEEIISNLKKKNIPYIIIVNKIDIDSPTSKAIEKIDTYGCDFVFVSCNDKANADEYRKQIKSKLQKITPPDFFKAKPILGDLAPSQGVIVLIVPIDMEAPRGRLILPQVQSIRDALDHDQIAVVLKETEYHLAYNILSRPPDIVVCDSQVVDFMVANTPNNVRCTTFSIIFSRFKGDLISQVRGAAQIDKLKKGDKVLIAEACSHHPMEDDIGRVKIPKWLRKYTRIELDIDISAGRDYPDDIKKYDLIIHCGGCMLTRTEQLRRIDIAEAAGVPITNYGVAISKLNGVLERVLEPFPEAIEEYQQISGA